MTHTNDTNPKHQPIAVSPDEAARLAGIGRTSLYAALSKGDLPSIKIGTRRLIRVEAIRDWLAQNEGQCAMPKSANLSRIKSLHTYTIQEAAEVSGVSNRTIHTWIANGLPAMTQARPILIRGDALIAFIKAQRIARKTNTKQNEFYCLKCRSARQPAGNLVECQSTGKRAKLIALCQTCETIMYKPVSVSSLTLMAKVFDLNIQDHAKFIDTAAAD